ncbi:XdhC family protein [Geomicrobium sp. JCM 19038]|uniref:XdhC family protein n=1 Tax=Geomicrobium sp. JCM 19038 TaxID=1460635 RepID=UPI00045F4ADA|nr:XdhC family protein [Geomicrobium sp. JCM 19038]GAK09917.1 XdhC protein [Geomicrobium sp. JCM 19038]
MENMHEILDYIETSTDRSMVATVIHVEGSAYRKEGASMLVTAEGNQVGVMSAGCLEEDIMARFEHVWYHGADVYEYDMRSDDPFSWGVNNSGCNGIVTVLLEPLTEKLRSELLHVKAELMKGHAVQVIKSIHEDDVQTVYQSTSNDHFGELLLLKQAVDVPMRSGMWQEMFVHRYEPKPRLFLFGANVDARPVASFAAASGFEVIVSDWRSGLCQDHYFPHATKFIIGFPKETIPTIPFRPTDYVVVMTHHFYYDRDIIISLKDLSLRYLGILGSKKRTRRLLGTSIIPSTITTPLGLSIGAEGPEQIAISAVAQLIEEEQKGDDRRSLWDTQSASI